MTRKLLWDEAAVEFVTAPKQKPAFQPAENPLKSRTVWLMEGTMTRHNSKILLALAAATIVFAASSASAATWICTAKNARGANYTSSAFGVFSQVVHDRAKAKALAACAANSVVAATCYIVSCTKTN